MRTLLVLALAGCFTPRTHAERPRALVYNALTIGVGVALALLGLAAAHAGTQLETAADDGAPGSELVTIAGGLGILGGAFAVFGGAAGIALSPLDLTPTH